MANNYIQEVPPASSGQIYRNVKEIINFESGALSNMILDRITSKINLQDSFAVSSFFHEAEIRTDSEEFHVFQSEHYRDSIFRKAEFLLWREGYECSISFDTSGRTRKISYSARVVHPLKKALRTLLPLISIATLSMSFYLYNFYNVTEGNKQQRHH